MGESVHELVSADIPGAGGGPGISGNIDVVGDSEGDALLAGIFCADGANNLIVECWPINEGVRTIADGIGLGGWIRIEIKAAGPACANR